jgi:hypothetical protein
MPERQIYVLFCYTGVTDGGKEYNDICKEAERLFILGCCDDIYHEIVMIPAGYHRFYFGS